MIQPWIYGRSPFHHFSPTGSPLHQHLEILEALTFALEAWQHRWEVFEANLAVLGVTCAVESSRGGKDCRLGDWRKWHSSHPPSTAEMPAISSYFVMAVV